MQRESGFDPDAVGYNTNGTTDHSLGQINSIPKSHMMADYNLDITNSYDNTDAMSILLDQFVAKYGLYDGLRCYAAGDRGAMEYGWRHRFAAQIIASAENLKAQS